MQPSPCPAEEGARRPTLCQEAPQGEGSKSGESPMKAPKEEPPPNVPSKTKTRRAPPAKHTKSRSREVLLLLKRAALHFRCKLDKGSYRACAHPRRSSASSPANTSSASTPSAPTGSLTRARRNSSGTSADWAQWASSEACAGGRDSSASEVISSWPWAASSSTSVASCGGAGVELDQEVDDDLLVVVLVEADVGEELAHAGVAEGAVGEELDRLRPGAALDPVLVDPDRAGGDPGGAGDHPLPAVLDRHYVVVLEGEVGLVVHAVEALDDRFLHLVDAFGEGAGLGVDPRGSRRSGSGSRGSGTSSGSSAARPSGRRSARSSVHCCAGGGAAEIEEESKNAI